MTRSVFVNATDLKSVDNAFDENRIKKGPGDENNRAFTYFMLGNARFIYASASRLVLMKVNFVTHCLKNWRISDYMSSI